MRLAILADESRAVHAKRDRQMLDRDIVDDAVVGALQLPVQLCLMRRQRDMLTQLPQELAIGAAEAVGLATRRHQHTKDLIFNQQRRDDEGTHARLSKPLREGKLDLARIRLVDQLTLEAAGRDTARQAVLIDRHLAGFGQSKANGERHTPGVDHGNGQRCGARLVKAHAAKIDRQILAEIVQHYSKEARQIVAFPGSAGDSMQ